MPVHVCAPVCAHVRTTMCVCAQTCVPVRVHAHAHVRTQGSTEDEEKEAWGVGRLALRRRSERLLGRASGASWGRQLDQDRVGHPRRCFLLEGCEGCQEGTLHQPFPNYFIKVNLT